MNSVENPTKRYGRQGWKKREESALKWLLLGVPLLILFAFIAFPLGYSLYIGFCDWNILKSANPSFVGLKNFVEILQDRSFWHSWQVTLHFTLFAVFFEIAVGMFLAVNLRRSNRGNEVLRTLVLLPYVVTGVVAGITWKWLMNPDFGLLRFFNEMMNLPGFSILGNPNLAIYGVVISDVWHATPFVFVLLLAGLQSLPEDVFEAASIDGASDAQKFFFITLPMMKNIIFIVCMMRILAALKLFDKLYSLTEGGPGTATQTINWTIYITGFREFSFGYASAMSYLLLIVVFIVGSIYSGFLKKGNM